MYLLDDFAWRFKAWFLNFFINSSFNILINTYNQGVLFPRKTLVVMIVHDHLFLTNFHEFGARKLYYNLIFRNPFTRPKSCIFISNTTRYEHLKFFKQPKNSEVIYWPTPKKKFQKKKSVKEIKEREVFFLNIASEGRYKNTDYLLREFETFKKSNKGVSLVLVGREGKNKNDTLFQKLAQEELNWLLDKCTAIILPSHYEGFGFPYQEAKIFSKRMLVYDMPVSGILR